MADETRRAGIEATLGTVPGSDLAAHLRRDGVVWVDAALDLVTVGVALAEDDASAVSSWLQRGLVRRPDADERAAWEAAPERPWRVVVVQPFVLVQALE